MLFKGSVSYRLREGTNVYFTRSEGYRIGGGNNYRVCTAEEVGLLTDADPANDPPQSGCIYGLTPFSAEPITLNGGGAVSRGFYRPATRGCWSPASGARRRRPRTRADPRCWRPSRASARGW